MLTSESFYNSNNSPLNEWKIFSCNFGIAAYAFDHFSEFGVVTGGIYDSNVGCLPYPFAPSTQPIVHKSGACDSY